MGFAVQILFFLTPVFWTPSQTQGGRSALLFKLNPFAHMLELIRQPVLGYAPALIHYEWALATTVVLAITAVTMLAFFRKRVVFWL